MSYLLTLLLMFFCFSSCTVITKRQVIDLDDFEQKELSIRDIGINSIEEIPLIIPDSLILVNSKSSFITKYFILVQDNVSNNVYIWNRKGQFLKAFESSSTIRNFRIAPCAPSFSGFSLIDDLNNKLLIFDSSQALNRQFEINPFAINHAVIDFTTFFSIFPNMYVEHNSGFNLFCNENGNFSKAIKEKIKKESIISFYNMQFLQDTLAYWEYSKNKIYHIKSPREIRIANTFNYRDKNLDFSRVGKQIDLLREARTKVFITRIIENRNIIFLELVNYGFVEFYLYNKNLNQLFKLSIDSTTDLPGLVNDISWDKPIIPDGATSEGNFYSISFLKNFNDSTNATGYKLSCKIRILHDEK